MPRTHTTARAGAASTSSNAPRRHPGDVDTPVASDVVGTLVLALAGPALLMAAAVLHATPATSSSTELTRAVGLAAGVSGVALLAWWCVGLAGLALMSWGRRRQDDAWIRRGARLTPAMLRRTGAAVLGIQLLAAPAAWAAGPASPQAAGHAAPVDASWLAHAHTTGSGNGAEGRRDHGNGAAPRPFGDTPRHPMDHVRPFPSSQVPDAAWTPARPVPAPPGAAWSPRPTGEHETVTVRDGDCLWDIAALELGPDATPREVDRRWRDWYRTNRASIGPDPSLLRTGTVLVTPVFSPHLPLDEARP